MPPVKCGCIRNERMTERKRRERERKRGVHVPHGHTHAHTHTFRLYKTANKNCQIGGI